jgi:hypothetical protein
MPMNCRAGIPGLVLAEKNRFAGKRPEEVQTPRSGAPYGRRSLARD